MGNLKRTPLYPEYERHGAKTIDFGGWDLPVQYTGIKHEHEVVRNDAGLFDVSHMGEILIKGPKSLDFLQRLVTNDVAKMSPGRCQYTFMCYENGGVVDDFLIYMLGEEEYLLVVNAANTDKDMDWLKEQNTFHEQDLTIENLSDIYVQLALQGPAAEEILQKATKTDLSTIRFFRFKNPVYFEGIDTGAIVSRTGYTGEDGFEIYIEASSGRDLWNLILDTGKDKGVEPIGLGARDTLRFEANLPLYGQELSPDITPLEAGLGFAVKLDKQADFIGKDRIKKQKEQGPERKLAGIEMVDKGIPRTDYRVLADGKDIGYVTSGTQAPTLKKNIGLALIQTAFTNPGTKLTVQVRKRSLEAVVIPTPFLK